MAEYKTYLAANILSEEKIVTYRLLSRSLKVHVNAAKEMLYEFHRVQNGKKPGTVHATYLISGTKREEERESMPIKKDGEDEYMQSSPFINSSLPQADEGTGASSVLTITLTREEDLEQTRAQYEHVNSIHIYSLGPDPLRDLQLLSDSSRELQSLTASEDPLSSLAQYGTITNPAVKRRSNRRPPPAPSSVPAVHPKSKPVVETKELPSKVKTEPKASQSSSAKDFFGNGKEKANAVANGGESSKESTPAPPVLKKESSSLFKSFAKAKPKLERKGTDSSAVASAAEDSPMKDVSDDEEETYVPPSKEIVDSDRKSRKEREAALKKMMDDDDEDEVVPAPEPELEEEGAEVLEEVKPKKEEEPVEEVKDGRRRGRRRVMKKRTVKDDEGYLVTKEEAVWESFSDDERAPLPKPKVQPSSATSKAKKPAAKAGQGNIMSFFGKK